MSGRIEWAEIRNTPARLAPEGEYSDGFGNQNDRPALAAGGSAVIEGTPAQWHTFALELLDEANELLAEDRDEEPPPTVAEVLDTAREALTLWAEGDDTAADDDAVALASALRLVLLLLSPEGAA